MLGILSALRQLFSPARPAPPVHRARRASDLDYMLGLRLHGMSDGEPDHVAFVHAAIDHIDWPKPIDLRRHGEQLSPDALREMGLRANSVLTHEFLAILNEQGRADPIQAANLIYRGVFGLAAHGERMARTVAAIGDAAMVQVIANNMAAGPCPACIKLARRPIPLSQAPSGPLPDCPHPTQCVLHWSVIYDPG